MLNTSQITMLEQFEQALIELIASPEYGELLKGDYHPDINVADAREAISYLLDYHSGFEPIAVSSDFQSQLQSIQLPLWIH